MPLWHLPIPLKERGDLHPQPFLAPRGWQRLTIATSCCNFYTLTFTNRLQSLAPQAWQGYHDATIPRPRICRSGKSAPSRTWTGDLCFDTKCSGLTDLAKRVQPIPVVDATFGTFLLLWRSGETCTSTLFGPTRLAPVSNCDLLLQCSYPYTVAESLPSPLHPALLLYAYLGRAFDTFLFCMNITYITSKSSSESLFHQEAARKKLFMYGYFFHWKFQGFLSLAIPGDLRC